MSTTFAYDTADFEREFSGRCFDRTVIITMNREAAGVTTWAGKLMELKVVNCFIIKI